MCKTIEVKSYLGHTQTEARDRERGSPGESTHRSAEKYRSQIKSRTKQRQKGKRTMVASIGNESEMCAKKANGHIAGMHVHKMAG